MAEEVLRQNVLTSTTNTTITRGRSLSLKLLDHLHSVSWIFHAAIEQLTAQRLNWPITKMARRQRVFRRACRSKKKEKEKEKLLPASMAFSE